MLKFTHAVNISTSDEGKVKMTNYQNALENALNMMSMFDDMELNSALKQCASDCGIAYGQDMGNFVAWAIKELAI